MGTTAIKRFLSRPVDAASVGAFRFLFGSLLFLAVIRFAARGWIRAFYVEPSFFFTYWGFSWVRPLPEWGMYLLFAALGLSALCVAAGVLYRPAIFIFFLGFTYAELIDQSTYLNHYYLVSLLCFLMAFLPLDRAYAFRGKTATVPFWCVAALRLQVGSVYVFAALAKLQPDWLLHGQPLTLWLRSQTDFPVLGPLFVAPATGWTMSWMGFLFDLTAPLFLSWKKTRPWAYAIVVCFHVLTWALFPIGIFPWVMIIAALVFFSPSWPRRFLGWRLEHTVVPSPHSSVGAFALAVFFAIQAFLPFRYAFYPGDVLWSEEGFRFSWRVMVSEKNGSLEYRVRETASGRTWTVNPASRLKPHQLRQAATQPDMILQLARRIAADFREEHGEVAVYADSWVSWNGRPAARLIDPEADLARQTDGLAPKPWILPAPISH